jgi:TRAP-type C4-dicarboxylate transport system permease small subunit
MNALRRTRTILTESAHAIGVALFALLFLMFAVQVGARYLFGRPLGWSSEAIMILFLWGFFWTAAFAVPLRAHISLDILVNALPTQARRIAAILHYLATSVVLALALPATIDYVAFMNRFPTAALELPTGIIYACFPMFMIAYGLRTLSAATALLLPGWRDRLGLRPNYDEPEATA